MRKFLHILVIVSILLTGNILLHGQNAPAKQSDGNEKTTPHYYSTIPYYCDFNNDREGLLWEFKNTETGSQNAHWYIWGNNSTQHYLMCGVGQDDYFVDSHPVTVLAERGIYLGNSNTVTISFNITVGGEDKYDYCMVFLAPANVDWEPSTESTPSYVGGTNDWDLPYALHFGSGLSGTKLSNRSNEDLSATITNPAPGQPYKLIFVWHNDSSQGDGQAVTIKNLRVTSEITPIAISSINLTDFTIPVWGAHPDTDLTGNNNYHVEKVTWFETTSGYSGSIMDPNDIFDNIDNYEYTYGGAFYFADIYVRFNDGCYFVDNYATVSINGNTQLVYSPLYMIAESDGSYEFRTTSFTVSPGNKYNITIGEMPVFSANKDGITNPNISGTVTFDTITNTLTLNNATVNGDIKINTLTDSYWINLENPTIKLIGDNTLDGIIDLQTANASTHTGSITINGNGKLHSKGLRVFNNININLKDCELDFSDPDYNWGTFGRGNNILSIDNVKASFSARQSALYNFSEINLTKCAITLPENAVIAKPQSNVDYTICESDGTTPAKDVVINRSSIGVAQNDSEILKIYPNPANDRLFIENAEGEWVKIYDNTGRLVKQEIYNGELNISRLANGIYAATVSNRVVKFMKN